MPSDETRNKTWNINHAKIEESFWKLYADTGEVPKIRELVNETGLTPKTVYEHYYDMDVSEITQKFKIHLDRSMGALAKKAEEGDVSAIQLLAKLVGWTEKRKTELDIKQKSVKVEFTD